MQKTRKITLYENKTQLIISAIDKIVVEIFNKKENGWNSLNEEERKEV